MRSILNNSRGEGTFEGWMQGMVFSILFVIIFGLIISGMNNLHGGNYEVEGLETSDIKKNFEAFQESTNEKLLDGEVTFGDLIISLSTSWDILISVLKMLLIFIVGGGWIMAVTSMLMIPDTVGIMFRGMYIAALFFIILRILFKRST